MRINNSKNIDIKKISPNFVLALINKWKNSGWYPKNVKISKKNSLEKNNTSIQFWKDIINNLRRRNVED